jgi:hypothetical protein
MKKIAALIGLLVLLAGGWAFRTQHKPVAQYGCCRRAM